MKNKPVFLFWIVMYTYAIAFDLCTGRNNGTRNDCYTYAKLDVDVRGQYFFWTFVSTLPISAVACKTVRNILIVHCADKCGAVSSLRILYTLETHFVSGIFFFFGIFRLLNTYAKNMVFFFFLVKGLYRCLI